MGHLCENKDPGAERQFIKIILWGEDQLSQQLPMEVCLYLLNACINESCLNWDVLNTKRWGK